VRYVYLKRIYPAEKDLQLNDVGVVSDGSLMTSTLVEVDFIRINKKVWIPQHFIEEFAIDKAGDNYAYKVCDRCFKRLETETFPNNRIKKGGVVTRRPSCKDCRKKKDGVKISQDDRDSWDKRKPEAYSIFHCPICKKASIVGIKKIVLDHNHSNGEVRGYLCESCNTGIGRFDDHPEILEHAIEWLEKEDKNN